MGDCRVDLRKYIGKTKTLEQDIVRTLLILFHFGEEIDEIELDRELKLVLRTEYYIQKLDFLLRNPDYLCYELLSEIQDKKVTDPEEKEKIKTIVKEIFGNHEPVLRRIPMQRFLYGAYERLDEVESFLTSVDFLRVRPQGTVERIHVKNYYLTKKGYDYIEKELFLCEEIDWYNKRCLIIKRYLGYIKASDLKSRQYSHETYSQARLGATIPTIIEVVSEKFFLLFGEALV